MTQLAPLQNPCVDIPSINQMHNLSSHSVISHYTHTYMQCYAYTGSYTHPLPIGYFVCVCVCGSSPVPPLLPALLSLNPWTPLDLSPAFK